MEIKVYPINQDEQALYKEISMNINLIIKLTLSILKYFYYKKNRETIRNMKT